MNPKPNTNPSEEHFDTYAAKNALRLARTAVDTSSFFAIRGPQGTGKTYPFQLIMNEWAEQKLACKPIYFKCVPECDPERFLRSLVQTVTGQKYASWQRPNLHELIELASNTLAEQPANFLFVDNLNWICNGAGEMLLFLFDTVKDNGVRLGMATTTRTQTVELLAAERHPAFLDTVLLSPLTPNENLASLAVWEPRLQALSEDYFGGREGGAEACKVAYEATKGNFKAMRSFLATILTSYPTGAISLKELERCLSLRRAEVAGENNFQLVTA